MQSAEGTELAYSRGLTRREPSPSHTPEPGGSLVSKNGWAVSLGVGDRGRPELGPREGREWWEAQGPLKLTVHVGEVVGKLSSSRLAPVSPDTRPHQ